MSEYLPYGDFKWLEVNNETINKVLNKSDESLYGYFLEVDLEVPEELHDFHKDYPMAPEKTIEDNMLSPYCSEIKRKYDIKSGEINKLVPNLIPKTIMLFIIEIQNITYHKEQD